MATTSTITNVQALTALLAHARTTGFDNSEVLAKMEHHLAQLAKPKAKSDLPTQTQRLNAKLKDELTEFFAEHPADTFTTQQVVDLFGSPNITTTQKATIVCGMLVTDGTIERLCIKGRVYWKYLTK